MLVLTTDAILLTLNTGDSTADVEQREDGEGGLAPACVGGECWVGGGCGCLGWPVNAAAARARRHAVGRPIVLGQCELRQEPPN